jgi:acetoin utilization deacetylase AcuC-like enzyme
MSRAVPLIYSPRYRMDIGPHVFPTHKYEQIRDAIASRLPPDAISFIEPQPASWDQLALVHTFEYLVRLRDGALTPEDIAQLELPWSAEMVDGFRTMVGGTVEAALIACGMESLKSEVRSLHDAAVRLQNSDFKLAVHIGGGLHHAFPNHGEGFCPFNDVAVAVRVLQSRGVGRAAIVDLDVHHGNGTAFIFENDSRVFTLSIHQQHNYPLWKPRGSLDVGLPDGAHDATFLAAVDRALPQAMASGPECVFYLAGADPYEDDQLGGLRLTRDGLRERDRRVIETVVAAGIPLVVTLAGGYARRVADTVGIHVATIEEAIKATTP